MIRKLLKTTVEYQLDPPVPAMTITGKPVSVSKAVRTIRPNYDIHWLFEGRLSNKDGTPNRSSFTDHRGFDDAEKTRLIDLVEEAEDA